MYDDDLDLTENHHAALRQAAGPGGTADAHDTGGYLEEWRGRWHGTAPLILTPGSTQAVADIVTYCAQHRIAVVPQGGNTGLVGGQIPHGQVLVSTRRLNKVRDVSPDGFTLTVEAGVTLAAAQEAALKADRYFPLSTSAEGTAQIGGILSTNAGGVHVVKYGNARDLCLGLEVVLPTGDIWDGLNVLRKNNTGYDLKHLFMGAEGTLGIITAAVLRLVTPPAASQVGFVALPSAAAAISLLSTAKEIAGEGLSAIELMGAPLVDLVHTAFPELSRPLSTHPPYYALLEVSGSSEEHAQSLLGEILERALTDETISDGTVAHQGRQAEALWAIRHNASAAMKHEPAYCVKCDISLPLPQIPAFLAQAEDTLTRRWPGCRIMAFGHVGDGNLHYDILGPADPAHDAAWRDDGDTVERTVHDIAIALGGSLSAEHGIGRLKAAELAERKSPVEYNLMRTIKAAIDPQGLMNPGALFPEPHAATSSGGDS